MSWRLALLLVVLVVPTTSIHSRDACNGLCQRSLLSNFEAIPELSHTSIKHFLNAEMFRLSRTNVGNTYAWWNVICRAFSGEPTHIAVIGGSVTAGHGCSLESKRRFIQKNCAWPARLFRWLQTAYPHWNLTISNFAAGATDSEFGGDLIKGEPWRCSKQSQCSLDNNVVLTSLRSDNLDGASRPPDMFIVEYAANDEMAFRRDRTKALRSTEQLIHSILRLPQSPALIYFEFFHTHPGGSQAEDWHSFLTSRYEIPVISYRNAVLRRANSSYLPEHGIHPDWRIHQLMAELLISAWREEERNLCDNPSVLSSVPPRIQRPIYGRAFCTKYETYLTSLTETGISYSNFNPLHHSSEVWAFKEDVPNKPGWVADLPSSSSLMHLHLDTSIVFKVTSRRGHVKIGYLRSYSPEMGVVKVETRCVGSDLSDDAYQEVAKLSGSWEDDSIYESVVVWDELQLQSSGVECYIKFSLVSGKKFKLVFIGSC